MTNSQLSLGRHGYASKPSTHSSSAGKPPASALYEQHDPGMQLQAGNTMRRIDGFLNKAMAPSCRGSHAPGHEPDQKVQQGTSTASSSDGTCPCCFSGPLSICSSGTLQPCYCMSTSLLCHLRQLLWAGCLVLHNSQQQVFQLRLQELKYLKQS